MEEARNAAIQRFKLNKAVFRDIGHPADVQAKEAETGTRNGFFFYRTSLKATAALRPLLSHYDAQLEARAWKPREHGVSPPLAWSTWDVTLPQDEECTGLLMLIQRPDYPQVFHLEIRVDQVSSLSYRESDDTDSFAEVDEEAGR